VTGQTHVRRLPSARPTPCNLWQVACAACGLRLRDPAAVALSWMACRPVRPRRWRLLRGHPTRHQRLPRRQPLWHPPPPCSRLPVRRPLLRRRHCCLRLVPAQARSWLLRLLPARWRRRAPSAPPSLRPCPRRRPSRRRARRAAAGGQARGGHPTPTMVVGMLRRARLRARRALTASVQALPRAQRRSLQRRSHQRQSRRQLHARRVTTARVWATQALRAGAGHLGRQPVRRILMWARGRNVSAACPTGANSRAVVASRSARHQPQQGWGQASNSPVVVQESLGPCCLHTQRPSSPRMRRG
jgi:hypothetical protein